MEQLGRFETLCGGIRGGLDEAMALKTGSESKGAAAFLALQGSAMGLLELKEVNRAVWEKVAEVKADTQRCSADSSPTSRSQNGVERTWREVHGTSRAGTQTLTLSLA